MTSSIAAIFSNFGYVKMCIAWVLVNCIKNAQSTIIGAHKASVFNFQKFVSIKIMNHILFAVNYMTDSPSFT